MRKLRAASASAFGDQATDSILNKRELVPNTNRHATEGSNPIWMTGVSYTNPEDEIMTKEDKEDQEMMTRRNNLNSRYAVIGSGITDQLDSLDANVLNEENSLDDDNHNSNPTAGSDILEDDDDDDDVGYAASHFSNGGSTIRVGSSATGKMGSPRSSSSGMGSGSGSRSRYRHLKGGGGGRGPENLYTKNTSTISSLFPSQMPTVQVRTCILSHRVNKKFEVFFPFPFFRGFILAEERLAMETPPTTRTISRGRSCRLSN